MIKHMYQLAMQTMKPWGFRPTRILSRCSKSRVPVSDVEETGDESSGRHTTELWQNYGYNMLQSCTGMVWRQVWSISICNFTMNHLHLDFGIEIYIYSNYSCSLNGGIRLEALNHIRKMMFKGQSSSQHHINTTCNMFLHAFFHRPNSRF